MIDKLDLRVPRNTPFAPSFGRLYAELQALNRGPFHSSRLYEYVGDLREFGHQVRLGLYCQMDKIGNHKLELIDVGDMSRVDILREVSSVFDVDCERLGVMRVDFAVDIPDVPLQWFRETVRVENKRFRAAVTGERFYSEMGTGNIQTLYFGKRPNLIRIYDKRAEHRKQFRDLVRSLSRTAPDSLPTFESIFHSNPESILTRVERQIGGRIPEQVATLGQVIAPGFEYQPFTKLKILEHAAMPNDDADVPFETHCTGTYLRQLAMNEGMQAVNALIAKRSNGNTGWARRKYSRYLPSASCHLDLTQGAIQLRFASSLDRQLNAQNRPLVSSESRPEAL